MEERINTLLPTLLNKEDSSYSTVKDLDNVLNHAEKLNVRNIAITGPFGSGKSSVLHTLMHDFQDDKRVYLPISLATLQANEGFSKTSDDDESISRNGQHIENLNRKIEYSILQQLIYKEKAEDVPNSRFRRIVHLSKEKLNKYSLGFLATIVAFLVVFEPAFARIDTIYSLLDFGYKINRIFDIVGTLWLLFAIVFVFRYIIKSYSNSKLNKLNLKDGEIEVVEDNSIFNKHLDEILYFFQVTDYNVVTIEDLDRFETSNIFLKLRELCQLINESKIVGRHITFIYAIKDDVFEDEERTKFFDYITTVIPVINPSNSKDKLKSALIEQGFDENEIPDEDLSEMAFFIQDMRILTNIVNEYKQYREKLCRNNGQKLDYTKLLAMIVYKNYHPQDFAELHRRKGKAYSCISQKRAFVDIALKEITKTENELKEQEDLSTKNAHLATYDLRMLFLCKIQSACNSCFESFSIDGTPYNAEAIAKNDEVFSKILNANSVSYRYFNANTYRYQSYNASINIADIKKEFNINKFIGSG